MSTGQLLGIAGTARAGKDTFASLLTAHLSNRKVSSFAFAAALKAELEPFFRSFGGTAYETDSARKALIRPILIAHGREKRLVSNGTYWIKTIEPAVKEALDRGEVVLVTDVRYNTHESDEVSWIKSLGGKIIYIERLDETGAAIQPANDEERDNDPLLRKGADVTLVWPTTDTNSLWPFVERAAHSLGLS